MHRHQPKQIEQGMDATRFRKPRPASPHQHQRSVRSFFPKTLSHPNMEFSRDSVPASWKLNRSQVIVCFEQRNGIKIENLVIPMEHSFKHVMSFGSFSLPSCTPPVSPSQPPSFVRWTWHSLSAQRWELKSSGCKPPKKEYQAGFHWVERNHGGSWR